MTRRASTGIALGLLAAACALGGARDTGTPPELALGEARQTYREQCAVCHGERRYGGYAPPLIPETLARKGDAALLGAILEGLPNTQMPAFAGRLAPGRARELVALLREPPGPIHWTLADVAASRVAHPVGARRLPPHVRPENLTLVVERGRGAVSILDGDRLQEIGRFPAANLHGGLKFDRRHASVFAATRDGTAIAYDLARLELRATAKVGVNTRNLAIAPDGAFVAAANQLPPGLALLDGELRPLAVLELEGQPSAVVHLPSAGQFALAMRDLPVLHLVMLPSLAIESLPLPEPFEDFVLVPGSQRLVASSRKGRRLLLYDLAARRVLASLETEGLPHLFSACFFSRDGALHAAFNHVGIARLSIVDVEAFEVRRELPLLGSGYFARTHAETPYIWVDTNTDTVQLVDKRTLALAEGSLTPSPGKKAMHVEFSADGGKAFLSIWDADGAVVVYDSRRLIEIARLPYAMPVGKYNAANKTSQLE